MSVSVLYLTFIFWAPSITNTYHQLLMIDPDFGALAV
jgi:hypothetical protein